MEPFNLGAGYYFLGLLLVFLVLAGLLALAFRLGRTAESAYDPDREAPWKPLSLSSLPGIVGRSAFLGPFSSA